MKNKGVELSIRTIAILALGIIVLILFLSFTQKGNEIMIHFEKTVSTSEGTYSSFKRRCELNCRIADGSFNASEYKKTEYCTITLNTTSLGGKALDHCYEDGGIVNVSCKIKDVHGKECDLSEGCEYACE